MRLLVNSYDFNARSPLFWEGDFENNAGRLLNNCLISNQLIIELTHIRDDGSPSCVDLLCAAQPFTVLETVALSSLDRHSKHNIIHGTLNVSIPMQMHRYLMCLYLLTISSILSTTLVPISLRWNICFYAKIMCW